MLWPLSLWVLSQLWVASKSTDFPTLIKDFHTHKAKRSFEIEGWRWCSSCKRFWKTGHILNYKWKKNSAIFKEFLHTLRLNGFFKMLIWLWWQQCSFIPLYCTFFIFLALSGSTDYCIFSLYCPNLSIEQFLNTHCTM